MISGANFFVDDCEARRVGREAQPVLTSRRLLEFHLQKSFHEVIGGKDE